MNVDEWSRREFIGSVAATSAMSVTTPAAESLTLIKPPALQPGDTLGLVAPASPVFEPSEIREGVRALEKLGFRVKLGKHVADKWGYLAGSDKDRARDLMEMFEDTQIKGIVALRGGYGTPRLLPLLDYERIRKNAKILIGYSDITALLLAIHQRAGMVTFHGAVALSTFNDYSTRYLLKTLTTKDAVGLIEPPEAAMPAVLGPVSAVKKVSGALVGGNLSLVCATLGTPYEIDTRDKVLFLEEVGEQPYRIDRMLTQLDLAGKLRCCKAILLDRCSKCGPAEYKPAFNNTLSIEEVFQDRLADVGVPVLYGLSIGHVADKPVLPLGIRVSVDVEKMQIELLEAAVC